MNIPVHVAPVRGCSKQKTATFRMEFGGQEGSHDADLNVLISSVDSVALK